MTMPSMLPPPWSSMLWLATIEWPLRVLPCFQSRARAKETVHEQLSGGEQDRHGPTSTDGQYSTEGQMQRQRLAHAAPHSLLQPPARHRLHPYYQNQPSPGREPIEAQTRLVFRRQLVLQTTATQISRLHADPADTLRSVLAVIPSMHTEWQPSSPAARPAPRPPLRTGHRHHCHSHHLGASPVEEMSPPSHHRAHPHPHPSPQPSRCVQWRLTTSLSRREVPLDMQARRRPPAALYDPLA